MTSLKQLQEEHAITRFEEISPKAVEHVENFYTVKRPDLYSDAKIDQIDFHGDNTADHVKRHINRILHPPKPEPKRIPRVTQGIPLGPFGTEKVPLVSDRERQIMIFRRGGLSFAQQRSVSTGRFAGGEGPTMKSLAKARTFFRSLEK